jgi:hydroxymethylpyrimidine/phosphomethylpyrimidine kinase
LIWRRDTCEVTPKAIPRVLSIAGSDSSGGAGIQADLKAFARCGVYGLSVITAVTAQSTSGIADCHVIPPSSLRAQIEAVLGDIGADAIKIGMLVGLETVREVAACIRDYVSAETPVVLDPVLRASTGAELLTTDGLQELVDQLIPLVTVLTPNVPEAHALAAVAGRAKRPANEDRLLAVDVLALGPRCVVLTGGHRAARGDLYCDAEQIVELGGERYDSSATHGTGCTHSAVLAAMLACGRPPLEAARVAARIAAEAVRDGLDGLGRGSGPVDVLGLAHRERDW